MGVRLTSREGYREEAPLMAGGLLVVVLVIAAAALSLDRISSEMWSGILTLTVLVTFTAPILGWLGRKESDASISRILLWGMLATAVGVLVRYGIVVVLYNDTSDAAGYSASAGKLAELLRSGVFTSTPPGFEGRPPETQRVPLVLSGIYVLTGTSRWAGSVAFAWMGMIGRLLMWRALRRAVPEADSKRYLLLVLFFPSLLYWPAAIGKEALMVLALGVVSFGAAQLLADRVSWSSVLTFVAGVSGLVFIRPHLGAIAVGALGAASLVGTVGGIGRGANLKSTFVRALAIVVLVVVAVIVLSQTARFFSPSGGDISLSNVLDDTQSQTTKGGSSFSAPAVDSPLDLPWAAVTVFARPFLWEADSVSTGIAAAEALALLVILVMGWRRIVGGLTLARRRSYLVFVLTFTVAFVTAFSYIGNFGILARQRTIMLSLVFALLAAPPLRKGRGLFGQRARPTEEQGESDPTGAPSVRFPVGHVSLDDSSTEFQRQQEANV